jgi:alpha-tubulin suppressor-like RCC1 family protein
MTIINVSLIKTIWMGTYNITTAYVKNNAVFYNGNSYIALKSVEGVSPDTLGTNWVLMTQGVSATSQTAANIISAASNPAGNSSYVEPARRVLALPVINNQGGFNRQIFLMLNNTIKSTGASNSYSNGDNTARFQANTVSVNGTPGTFTTIYEGMGSAFAIDSNGNVWCWGYNGYGQLGLGDTTDRMALTQITYFATNNIKIAKIVQYEGNFAYTTQATTLFLTTTGTVYGAGFNGQNIIDATGVQRSTPTLVPGLSDIINIYLSGYPCHAAAITNSGNLYLWGYNSNGQLGFGDTTSRTQPTLSSLTNVSLVAVSQGANTGNAGNFGYTLVVSDGTLYAAGYNGVGQLGVGDTTQRTSFTAVSGITGNITAIEAHDACYGVSLAITSTNNIYLWGYNGYGALGNGTTTQSNAPYLPTLGAAATFQGSVTNAKIVGCANYTTIFIYSSSLNAICGAGLNSYGCLSNGTTSSALTFGQILGISGTILDYQVHGANVDQSTLTVLYSDGRAASAGYNGNGECGTRTNAGSQNTLGDILF